VHARNTGVAMWYLKRGSGARELDEAELRTALRGGRLTGLERIRAEGQEQWSYVYELDLYRELRPGAEPRAHARRNVISGLVVHLILFLGVMGWVVAGRGSVPVWGGIWGALVLLHLVQGVRVLAMEQRSAERDDYVEQLGQALAATGDLLPATERDRIEQRALALHRRRLALVEAGGGRDALEAEREAVHARLGATDDARTVAAFEEEAAALDERLEVLDQAVEEAARLAARERTLLHELEGLRLAVLQAEAHPEAPSVGAQLERVRGELSAMAEVEAALAQARRVGDG